MRALGIFLAVIGVTQGGDAPPRLPSGPAPVQIIARMDDKGARVLVIPYTAYVRKDPKDGDGSIVMVSVTREETRSMPLKETRVYGADVKEIDRERLPDMLRKPSA